MQIVHSSASILDNFDYEQKDAIEILLDKWASLYMKTNENPVKWYPKKASGGFIASWIKDSEESLSEADNDELEKIDSSVESLLPRYVDAIYKHYGLGARVFKFAIESSFQEAKEKIRPHFVTRGLV